MLREKGTSLVPGLADSVENLSRNVAPFCSFFSSTLKRSTPHGGPARQLWCVRRGAGDAFPPGSSGGPVFLRTPKAYSSDGYHLIEASLQGSNGFHSGVVCVYFL